jgi:cell division septation protein DedD
MSIIKSTGFKFLLITTMFLLVFCSLSLSAQAKPATSQIDDLSIQSADKSSLEIKISGKGNLQTGKLSLLDNPPRVFYDFDNTILNYNGGRTKSIPVNKGNLKSIAISQNQNDPYVVRVVFYFNAGHPEQLIRNVKTASKNNQVSFKIFLTGDSSLQTTGEKPHTTGKIDNLFHQKYADERDSFVIECTSPFNNPTIWNVESGIILTFQDVEFEVDADSGNAYIIPVDGLFIYEVEIVNQTGASTMFLKVKPDFTDRKFKHIFNRQSGEKLTIDFYPENSSVQLKPNPDSQSTPPEKVNFSGGEKNIKKVESVTGAFSPDSCKIVRLQYHPLEKGDRFLIEADGEFKPEFRTLKNPDRLLMRAPNAVVLLPQDAQDRMQVKIDGSITDQVSISVDNSSNMPESSIQFHYKLKETEKVQYNFYPTAQQNIYYLDIMPVDAAQRNEIPDDQPSSEELRSDSIEDGTSNLDKITESKREDSSTLKVTYPVEQNSDQSGDFNIPDESEYDSVVKIPRTDDESSKETVSSQSEEEQGMEQIRKSLAFRVIAGTFLDKSNAVKLMDDLKSKGFESILKEAQSEDYCFYIVQTGAFNSETNASRQLKELEKKGFKAEILKDKEN